MLLQESQALLDSGRGLEIADGKTRDEYTYAGKSRDGGYFIQEGFEFEKYATFEDLLERLEGDREAFTREELDTWQECDARPFETKDELIAYFDGLEQTKEVRFMRSLIDGSLEERLHEQSQAFLKEVEVRDQAHKRDIDELFATMRAKVMEV